MTEVAMTDLVEKVAATIHNHWQNGLTPWDECCRKLPGQAEDFRAKARLAIPIVQEDLLREMMKPTEEMLLAANAATASWMDVKGSQLTVNKEKHKKRLQAILRVVAKSKGLDIDG